MMYSSNSWQAALPILGFMPLLIVLALWSVVWKGLALWHSARRGQNGWFIIMLVVNTVGILEIVYLFGVAKLKINELFSSKK